MSTSVRRFWQLVVLLVIAIVVLAGYLLLRPKHTQFKLDVQTVTVQSEVNPVEGEGSTETRVRERFDDLIIVLDPDWGVKLEANWYAQPLSGSPPSPNNFNQPEIRFDYRLSKTGTFVFTEFLYEGVINLKNGAIRMTEKMEEQGGDRHSSHIVSIEAKLVPIN